MKARLHAVVFATPETRPRDCRGDGLGSPFCMKLKQRSRTRVVPLPGNQHPQVHSRGARTGRGKTLAQALDTAPTPTHFPDSLNEQYARADRLMLAALLVYACTAIGIVMGFERPGLTVGAGALWTLGLAAPGVLAGWLAGGTLFSRLAMATSLSGLVMLQIQASAGLREAHFGVFVTLALLMAYLDWRPVLLSAVLFAVHHIAFDRLQAAGWGLYCLTEPHFGIILAHAGYVIVQTAFELFFVIQLASSVRGSTEVAWLARHMKDPTHIVLETSGVQVQAALARLARCPVIALGGMNASRFRHLKPLGAYGWAAIDALT